LERLTAQDQVLSAELQLASAEYDRKFLYLSILRQTGQLHLPDEQILSFEVAPVPSANGVPAAQ
jgi:outer membrane protein TolC